MHVIYVENKLNPIQKIEYQINNHLNNNRIKLKFCNNSLTSVPFPVRKKRDCSIPRNAQYSTFISAEQSIPDAGVEAEIMLNILVMVMMKSRSAQVFDEREL